MQLSQEGGDAQVPLHLWALVCLSLRLRHFSLPPSKMQVSVRLGGLVAGVQWNRTPQQAGSAPISPENTSFYKHDRAHELGIASRPVCVL